MLARFKDTADKSLYPIDLHVYVYISNHPFAWHRKRKIKLPVCCIIPARGRREGTQQQLHKTSFDALVSPSHVFFIGRALLARGKMHPLPSPLHARFSRRTVHVPRNVLVLVAVASSSSLFRQHPGTMEIFINRPIRLKKFDPVDGRDDEMKFDRRVINSLVLSRQTRDCYAPV